MRLRADGVEVASYVVSPGIDPRHGLRPYLHPVRTLNGVTVTDALAGPGYTLVFGGLSGADRWFVRTGIYPGVCAALAFERPPVVPAGGAIERRLRVLVADGALSPDQVEAYCRHEV